MGLLTPTLLFLNLGPSELAVVLFLALLLFGAERIPRVARALGRAQHQLDRIRAEVTREADRERLTREFEARYGEREDREETKNTK